MKFTIFKSSGKLSQCFSYFLHIEIFYWSFQYFTIISVDIYVFNFEIAVESLFVPYRNKIYVKTVSFSWHSFLLPLILYFVVSIVGSKKILENTFVWSKFSKNSWISYLISAVLIILWLIHFIPPGLFYNTKSITEFAVFQWFWG